MLGAHFCLLERTDMRKLVYYVATTLDGYIAGPDGGDPSGAEFFPLAQDLISFMIEHYPEALPTAAREALGISDPGTTFDTVLEGRASYEVGLAAGTTDAYRHLRHLVFSTTLKSHNPDVEIVPGSARQRVRQLKNESGKDLWLVGGGKLAHSLLPEIDRLILKQNPSVIGAGIPLFDGPFEFHRFQPVAQSVLDSGIRVLTYDRVSEASTKA